MVGAWFVEAICFFWGGGEIYQIIKTRMRASYWNIVGFLITPLASMAILSEHHGIAQWVSAYLRIAIFRFQMICVLDEFELVDVCICVGWCRHFFVESGNAGLCCFNTWLIEATLGEGMAWRTNRKPVETAVSGTGLILFQRRITKFLNLTHQNTSNQPLHPPVLFLMMSTSHPYLADFQECLEVAPWAWMVLGPMAWACLECQTCQTCQAELRV